MQASLRDLSSSPNSQSFQVCQRTLHRCHEIIFSDLPSPASIPYSGLSVSFRSRFSQKKVKSHVEPALVGLGLVLAGAPAMPKLTEIMGEVALQQGRADDDDMHVKNMDTEEETVRGSSVLPTSSPDTLEDDDNSSDEKMEVDKVLESEQLSIDPGPEIRPNSELERRRTVVGARTSPALVQLRNAHRSHLSEDPLDQLDPSPVMHVPSPYQSSPSIPSSHSPLRYNASAADSLLQRYDLPSQSYLLRNHYSQSEVGSLTVHVLHAIQELHPRFNFCSHWKTYRTAYSSSRSLPE